MQRIEIPINGGNKLVVDADPDAEWIAILNPTGYNVNVYRGADLSAQNRVAFASIYANVSLPLPSRGGRYTIEWTGGAGADKITVVFSDVSLQTNQTMVSPGGSSTVIISGDSVGLAQQSQLPAALGPNLGMKVELIADSVGTKAVDPVDRGGRLLGVATLGAGAAAIGTVGVTALPALPTGTNVIGGVRPERSAAVTAGANPVAVGVAAVVALAANAARKQMTIQNVGTTVIFLGFGRVPTATNYDLALSAGSAAHDGKGGSVNDQLFTGQVQAISSAAGGLVAAFEQV